VSTPDNPGEMSGAKGKGEFVNRVALIAGGTGALGREIALALLSSGARVIVTYRQREEFDSLVGDSNRAGLVSPVGISADTTDLAVVADMAQKIAEQYGTLDILVNAVGGYVGGKNVWEEDLAEYQRMMALNLQSGFALTHAVVPIMIRQSRGWVVNIASRAGYGHSAGAALYAAAKAAALSFFESLAAEVKPYPINVNSVVPSIFDTPANRRAMPSANFALWPKPQDIASVILFLCSNQARLIHGAAIPVYGRT
jgi:NAD(P)-dependent dehydrogenase (short-subunit alcohol dehydrogenase family)